MQAFACVVERGSFARAAQSLGLSRARVSEAIKALEQSLGTTLLHRSTRRLSLTDDGRGYYERVRGILDDVAEAEAEVVRGRGVPSGRLRVDMPVALGRLFVVPKLPAIQKQYPELELEIRLENRQIDLTREGVDCIVSYGEPSDPDLVPIRLATTHLVTCAAPSYLARRGRPVAPEELARHETVTFLDLGSARPSPWSFRRGETTLSERPASRLAFNSMEACVDAAALGLGVTQVLSAVALPAIRAGRVVPVLLDLACPGPPLFFAFPENRRSSARLRVLLEFLRRVFAELDAGWQDLLDSAAETPAKTKRSRR